MSKREESLSKTFCGGRCTTGPDRFYFYLTLSLVVLPQIPFLVIICQYFEQYVSPAVYVIAAYLCVISMVCFFCAAFSDPGILPRGPALLEEENPFAMEQKIPMVKKVMVKGVEVDSKWCDTCKIYRPPRSSHCSVCGNCVDKFDHHCPWIGNCIGRRNYRFYLLFVFMLTVDCIFIIALSVIHIVLNVNASHEASTSSRFRYAMDQAYYFSIILPVLAAGGLCFVGGLCGFHCFLVSAGVSTSEFVKKTYKGRTNPHSRGIFLNHITALCNPWYPSFIHFRIKQRTEVNLEPIVPLPSEPPLMQAASSV